MSNSEIREPAVSPEGQKEVNIDPDIQQIKSLSRFQLMKRAFFKNKLAIAAGFVLIILYITMVFFPNLFSTHPPFQQDRNNMYAPPQRIRFFDVDGNFNLRPFVYPYDMELDFETFQYEYTPNYDEKKFIYFFNRGFSYKLGGFWDTDIHFMGLESEEDMFFIFGSDRMGRDIFSRTVHAGRVSLTVGLVGVALTIILGSFFGTLSGYMGGIIDQIIQRIIEILLSFPTIPLWAALAAALPQDWSSIRIFFGISIIIALRNWAGLGRQVRGKVMSFRESEYTIAARIGGASHLYIILHHMIPNAFSHIIVIGTLSIPAMIIAETALSFLGLGIQPPMVSWGTLLEASQRVNVVINYPWIMIPGLFVVIAVLAFNFLGDGFRDAADPFSS